MLHSSAVLALRQQQEAISILCPDHETSKPFYLITVPLAFISAALLTGILQWQRKDSNQWHVILVLVPFGTPFTLVQDLVMWWKQKHLPSSQDCEAALKDVPM